MLVFLTVTGLSLWLNNFELSNTKNFSNGVTFEEDSSCDCHSTYNNITLHDDASDHSSAVIFGATFTIAHTNCSVNITLPCPGLTNDKLTSVICKTKSFKDYAYTHWLFLLNTTLSLSNCKCCSAQFTKHSQQNVYDKSLSAITRIVHNWCDDNVGLWCNVTDCCNTWPGTSDLVILLDGSPCVSKHHKAKISPFDCCMPSLAIMTDAFAIVWWLFLAWRRGLYHLIKIFCSTAKSLAVTFCNVIASYCHNPNHIQSFKSVQHWCDDDMCCPLKRIQILDPINSCTVSKHNIKEVIHNTAYNDPLSTAVVTADDEVLMYGEEAGRDQSYWALEDVHENVLHVFDTCECNSIQNEDGAELVVGTTQWTKGIITASHDASPDIRCSCDDDIPVCIPSSDSSHEVVSVCAGLHYQLSVAGYRNANHTFVQDEKNSVEGNLFSFSSPLDNTCETNDINFESFRQRCYIEETVSAQDTVNDTDSRVNTEIDVIEVTPIEEETNQSNHSDQGEDHIKDQPEDAKGIEKDDDNNDDDSDDSDDSDCIDDCEECCSVEECQPCDATSDEINGTNKLNNALDDGVIGVQCCSDDSGEFLIGIYNINKAYGADHNILSVNGQVLYIHMFDDAVCRPVVGDHGSKPKASNNQPPAFEYTTYNKLTVNQSQETASLAAAAGVPYATRTECSKHQTFDDDTFVEKDGRLRDDGLTTLEEQRYTTKDPNQPEQIRRIGPDYSDAKFREDVPLFYEEVKQNSKAKTTFLQHEVEDRSLKQNIVQNDHSVLPQVTHHNVASNTTGSKPRSLPRKSCIVVGNTQYPLAPYLLAHPHMDHFFVKERKEMKPGHFLAKLVLQHHYLIM